MTNERQVIIELQKIAKVWKDELVSKKFLIVYGKDPYQYTEIIVRKGNFMHLTGVKHFPKISADSFFERTLRGTLNPRAISLDQQFSKNYLRDKLLPLSLSPNFLLSMDQIGFARDPNYRYGMGAPIPVILFRDTGEKDTVVPTSFVHAHINSKVSKVRKICAVYWKPIDSRDPKYHLTNRVIARQGLDETLLDERFFHKD